MGTSHCQKNVKYQLIGSFTKFSPRIKIHSIEFHVVHFVLPEEAIQMSIVQSPVTFIDNIILSIREIIKPSDLKVLQVSMQEIVKPVLPSLKLIECISAKEYCIDNTV